MLILQTATQPKKFVSIILTFSGYYCPIGTPQGGEVPCRAGTFNNQTTATNDTFCVLCPAGNFCDGEANTDEGLPCQQGYYCPGNLLKLYKIYMIMYMSSVKS